MSRNAYYDILFEPVAIGPVTAPNRFYQTPHATGMGNHRPNSSVALRAVKAEGGWGVVCTEYCSIHPSADEAPYAFLTIWDDEDVQQLSVTADAIHKYGSLAGIELWHGGFHCNNRNTREQAIAPSACSAEFSGPGQVREMSLDDIQDYRHWHRDAAIRAMNAGFDIIYVYAGHEYLPFQFLSPRFNHRNDDYGGSLENRMRLLRELIEDTKAVVGHQCAVAVRLAIDELHGEIGICRDGEGRQIVEALAELPDLWDLALGGSLGNDSCSSRFSAEGYQEQYASFVKTVSSKPVVSVGRFTSPETMVGQIKRGIQDFIGAARPSIADPFLPEKINHGREDEIRECIGCNICRSANNEGVPLRCTQNPTMGEEWRRSWHPDRIPEKHDEANILVVGGGPAGLEATLALGQRGYHVTLAEASDELGGRLLNESKLPGLNQWIRVRDYRRHLISRMANVNVYLESELSPIDINDFGADHVVLATGSHWRRDGLGNHLRTAIKCPEIEKIITPSDIFNGAEIEGDILIYDDDHYFMAGALAEKFLNEGHRVSYITPSYCISQWTEMTDEQSFIQTKLLSLGLEACFGQTLHNITDNKLTTTRAYTGEKVFHGFDNLLLVTSRQPKADLYDHQSFENITRIGDCQTPSSIADAVFSGHKFAREFGENPKSLIPKRERTIIECGDIL